MKRKQHTPEQIVGHLRDVEAMGSEGKTVAQICKELGVSEQTYHRWRRAYGSSSTDQVRRLKHLERENSELKKLLAGKRKTNRIFSRALPRGTFSSFSILRRSPPRMARQRHSDKASRVALTKRQAYWLEHHRACETSGLTAKAYAKKHRISVHALYQARKDLRQRQALASPTRKSSVTFARVHAVPTTRRESSWRIRFPNGAVIELEPPLSPDDQVRLLQSVARLS